MTGPRYRRCPIDQAPPVVPDALKEEISHMNVLFYVLEHWPLNDPAKATGSEEEIMAVFRASRDDIRQRVTDLVERLQTEQG